MPITRRCLLAALVVLLAVCSGGALQANAQGTTVTLTILVPDWTRDILNQAVFDEFEAQHPGVQVVLAESPDVPGIPPAADDLDFHLDMVENYVSAADVVFVTSDQWTFSVEATRAGYLLDLAPLVASDPTFDAQDFFPAVWQSYQWDGGVWALPASAGVLLVTYDTAAFDRLGIPYPAGDWTLEDYAEASRALAEAGNGNFPGFITFNRLGLLFYSLTGAGFFDPSTPEAMPYFTAPALEAAVRLWAQLEAENAAVQYTSGDFQRVPMRIDEPYTLSSFAQETGADDGGGAVAGWSRGAGCARLCCERRDEPAGTGLRTGEVYDPAPGNDDDLSVRRDRAADHGDSLRQLPAGSPDGAGKRLGERRAGVGAALCRLRGERGAVCAG